MRTTSVLEPNAPYGVLLRRTRWQHGRKRSTRAPWRKLCFPPICDIWHRPKARDNCSSCCTAALPRSALFAVAEPPSRQTDSSAAASQRLRPGTGGIGDKPLGRGSTPPCSSTLWNSGIIPMREPARRDMVCPQARQEICVPESGGTGSTSSATSQCRHALAVSVLIGFDYSVRCRTRARLP
jgi:hypothetical protein